MVRTSHVLRFSLPAQKLGVDTAGAINKKNKSPRVTKMSKEFGHQNSGKSRIKGENRCSRSLITVVAMFPRYAIKFDTPGCIKHELGVAINIGAAAAAEEKGKKVQPLNIPGSSVLIKGSRGEFKVLACNAISEVESPVSPASGERR